jgi:FtsH-binding integral membrane protein
MEKERHLIPVWFFIGVLLLTYGLIIFGTGVCWLSHPPETVLARYHPAIWWGILLVVIGAFYTYSFRRGKG